MWAKRRTNQCPPLFSYFYSLHSHHLLLPTPVLTVDPCLFIVKYSVQEFAKVQYFPDGFFVSEAVDKRIQHGNDYSMENSSHFISVVKMFTMVRTHWNSLCKALSFKHIIPYLKYYILKNTFTHWKHWVLLWFHLYL